MTMFFARFNPHCCSAEPVFWGCCQIGIDGRRSLLDLVKHSFERIYQRIPDLKLTELVALKDQPRELVHFNDLLDDERRVKKFIAVITSRRRWYDVSAEGLLEASKFTKEFTGNLVGTITQLGKCFWPDFELKTK